MYSFLHSFYLFFFFNYSATTEIYTLSLHDALPIFSPSTYDTRLIDSPLNRPRANEKLLRCETLTEGRRIMELVKNVRSEEHTSELQSHSDLVCRLLLEKKKKKTKKNIKKTQNTL